MIKRINFLKSLFILPFAGFFAPKVINNSTGFRHGGFVGKSNNIILDDYRYYEDYSWVNRVGISGKDVINQLNKYHDYKTKLS